MSAKTPTTITATSAATATSLTSEEQLHERTNQLRDMALRGVATRSVNTGECRELALMLGLVEDDPSGSLVKANPWDAEVGDSLPRSPRR